MIRAVKFEKLFCLRLLAKLKWPINIIFDVSFAIFLVGFLSNSFEKETLSLLLAFVFLSFSLGGSIFILLRFLEYLKLNDSSVSFEVTKALLKKQTNSSQLLYYILKNHSRVRIVFSRLMINYESLIKQLEEDKSKGNLKTVLEATEKIVKGQRIETEHLIAALAQENQIFKQLVISSDITAKDIQRVIGWQKRLEFETKELKKFWKLKNLRRRGGFAKDWASGYTTTLNRFSEDLTKAPRALKFFSIIGHKRELKGIERILARQNINNVLLIGEPGSGRKTIISSIAQKSMLGESMPDINYKRIMRLDIPTILAQAKNLRDVESTLDMIFKESTQAGNVILVIDEFHNFVGGEKEDAKLGMIDITGILLKYLNYPAFQIIATTSFSGLHRYIEPQGTLLSLFEKVEVAEISKEEAFVVLEDLIPGFEKRYKRGISYQAIREIIELSFKYIQAVPFPKKAVDLLDESMVYLSQTKDKLLLPKHIEEIVEERTQIPIGKIETEEKETLLNLENLIHKRIINQSEAVKEVSSALRRARSEIGSRKGPMGDFLFMGPTGVGKTETAKALAAIYFGSESKMIRLDMSEFQSVSDIPRLLGTSNQEGLLTTPVRENPFSLVLLDELEKAHSNILNLFLQILDEGYITDGLGRKVSFLNTIIIATSNAGYRIILKSIAEKKPMDKTKKELLDYLFEKGIFRPEFLNRFDAVVVFQTLNKEHLLAISGLMMNKLIKGLKDKGIEFVVTEKLKEKIVELGYNPTFGARNMKRVIQDKVENVIATALLSGDIKRGDRISMDARFSIEKQ